jgi:hypothetical protein
MGAMKRLHQEYARSGWNLDGFRVEERPAWRRLLADPRSPVQARYERQRASPGPIPTRGPDGRSSGRHDLLDGLPMPSGIESPAPF